MSRVFIFSNSFTAKTISLSINNILNTHIDEVILLSENHEEYEFSNLLKDIRISLVENIEKAVFACDVVLICITPNIPLKKINYVKSAARRTDKQLIVIECIWESSFKNKASPYFSNIDSSNCIVILNISLSPEAQQFNGEILLNRILSKNCISFKQFFSPATINILEQLNEIQMLKPSLAKQFCKENERFDVAVLSVTLSEFKDSLSLFNEFKPDYIIVQSDFRGNAIDEIVSLLKRRFNVSYDYIIKSHYIQVENSIPFQIYCNSKKESIKNENDIEASELPSALEFDLLSKIALPNGIKRF